MSKSKEIRTLPVKLTDSDILEMSSRASSLHKEANRLRVEAKKIASEFKENVTLCTSEHSKLQSYIYNKEEPRKVDCQWFTNKALKKRVLRRLDTMQAIETKPLEDEDMQQDLFGQEEITEDPVLVEAEHKTLE